MAVRDADTREPSCRASGTRSIALWCRSSRSWLLSLLAPAPSGCGGLGLLIAVLLGAAAQSATPYPELRKVHALLVIDTRSGLGESVKIDGDRIDHLLSYNLPKVRAEIRVLTGKDVGADAILAYYRDLDVDRNDALFFYYSGHGATDPRKGHFLGLQELGAKPLLRSDLRRAMQAHQLGLIVIMTDCCSDRFKLPGKLRRVYADTGVATTIHPVLRCLLYQSRGVVDITAASGNVAFGDDHDGGVFTRAFDKLVRAGISRSDADHDGFVTWSEFFTELKKETELTFVTWAQYQRRLGERVDQASQRPHAYELGRDAAAVLVHNETAQTMEHEYRWAGNLVWEHASLAPKGFQSHAVPAGRGSRAPPVLEVRFEGGRTAELQVGKTYRFHESR